MKRNDDSKYKKFQENFLNPNKVCVKYKCYRTINKYNNAKKYKA